MASKNPCNVAYMFCDYTHGIHSKAIPSNPNFIYITITCGKIKWWCKCNYPSCITIGNSSASFNPADTHSWIILADEKHDAEIKKEKQFTAI